MIGYGLSKDEARNKKLIFLNNYETAFWLNISIQKRYCDPRDNFWH